MKRQAVESPTMRSVGYEAKSKVLEIEFESGVTYQYLEVPQTVAEALFSAESKGTILQPGDSGDYECIRVGAKREAGRG